MFNHSAKAFEDYFEETLEDSVLEELLDMNIPCEREYEIIFDKRIDQKRTHFYRNFHSLYEQWLDEMNGHNEYRY